MAEEKALEFVTKKVLVTFSHQICLPINGVHGFTQVAICEYQESPDTNRYNEMPRQLTVVGLPDKKLEKSVQVHLGGYGGMIAAMVELD